ncbi:fatty acid--CoA ligase [Desulfopila inferna]|uniref:fatty acid--CoA ligase n=1 Tax=Desulfopila inferna TaxID=468528 RepID=UPI001966AB37|nr:fatty acid--CoA ligase [Desulfopila inferna]MBM9606066.1 fatty acid--CoA ligase [Desulfopila inferna]
MQTKIIPATPSAFSQPLLIKNLLISPLIYSPNQRICYRDQIEFTYQQFGKRICRLANSLNSLGVRPGDTVAVMDWDSHRYLECYFAIPMIGAVLHTVNVRLSSDQLLYTINHAEDDVIFVNAEFLPLLEAIRDKLTTVKKIVLINDGATPPQTDLVLDHEYETMLRESSEEYSFPDFDENSIATTFYTTGTTGLPKGVYFSHRQLVMHTLGIIAALCGYDSQARISSADVYMPITPMFHVHAWGMPYLMTYLGAKQVYPGRYEPDMLLRLITTKKVSFSHCVPTIMHMLLSSPIIDECDLNGWKVIIGGSALSSGMCKAALNRGINIYTGYGMSETCPILTLANLKPHMLSWDQEKQIKMRCRTGLPISNVHLEIVDPHGNPLPHDGKSTGEVVVRAPWLTQGYLKDPEKSEELWAGNWLHTGDIGFIDDEGYLQITDRLKDVIKTGGEWISSLELEDIISKHDGVSEVAVIGVADSKWGERPLALVVPKQGFDIHLSEADIKSVIQQSIDDGTLPRYGMPERVLIVDSITKTSVGKLNKKALREEFASN